MIDVIIPETCTWSIISYFAYMARGLLLVTIVSIVRSIISVTCVISLILSAAARGAAAAGPSACPPAYIRTYLDHGNWWVRVDSRARGRILRRAIGTSAPAAVHHGGVRALVRFQHSMQFRSVGNRAPASIHSTLN